MVSASPPCLLSTRALPEATVVLQRRCLIGVAEFIGLETAYAAIQRCAASMGGLMKKNGARSSQKKPCEIANPPFDPTQRLGNSKYPQLTLRMACDRRHNSDYEHVRNVTSHCVSTQHKRPNVTNKGMQQLCCRWVVMVVNRCKMPFRGDCIHRRQACLLLCGPAASSVGEDPSSVLHSKKINYASPGWACWASLSLIPDTDLVMCMPTNIIVCVSALGTPR
jgi:hypothetical protein